MKAVIVDDERKATVVLSNLLLTHCKDIEIAAIASSCVEAMEAISKYEPDVVFLDAELANETGFDLLKEYSDHSFKVIFVTAHSQYAIKAIKHEVHDYLLKPVMLDELLDSLGRLKASAKNAEDHGLPLFSNHRFEMLIIPSNDGQVMLQQNEILRLKGDGAYTQIYCEQGKHYTASYNLAHFEKQLNPDIFLRCHKSHVINLQRVHKVQRSGGFTVQLSNGEKVEISKTYRKVFDERIKLRTR